MIARKVLVRGRVRLLPHALGELHPRIPRRVRLKPDVIHQELEAVETLRHRSRLERLRLFGNPLGDVGHGDRVRIAAVERLADLVKVRAVDGLPDGVVFSVSLCKKPGGATAAQTRGGRIA